MILKAFFTVIFTIFLVLVAFGFANAGFWESFLTNLDPFNNSGTIPANVILLLLITGLIGYLGVRRK